MNTTAPATALTIAGSDPSGGAGLQADLATFRAHRVFGMAVVTLITVQNTRAVSRVEPLDAELVAQQLDAVLDDIAPDAVKTGALGSAEVISRVADRAERFAAPLVVDPVMISKHGDPLLPESATDALRRTLIPKATLLTPNRHEAAALTGVSIDDETDAERAARALLDLGAGAVVITGTPREGAAADLLVTADAVDAEVLQAPRIDTRNLHGSGCVFAAAITSHLAQGASLGDAVRAAKRFITEAIGSAPGLGSGHGPTNTLTTPSSSG
jgi:hydroxymethylpyrimidine/phosphomethylpyrimidine kinase